MKSGNALLRHRAILYVLLMSVVVSGCMLSPDAKSARYMDSGKKLLQSNDPGRAILQFRNAARATPNNAEVYYQLGLAYVAAQDLNRAGASFAKALELNPRHAPARLGLAQVMTTATNPAIIRDAQRRLQALVQESPDGVAALHALALTELKLGDPSGALLHLERALSAAPKELSLAVTLAQGKLLEKDPKGAEEVLQKACANLPKSPDAAIALGRFFVLENRTTEAERQFRKALELDPGETGARFNLATLENQSGRKQEAEQEFKRLSGSSDKTYKPVYAIFLFQEGRRDEAVREFERLAAQDPGDRLDRTRLVMAYRATNRLADAQQVLEKALKGNPSDLDALLQRGELFTEGGKYAAAEADLNRVRNQQSDSPEVHYALAMLHKVRGEAEMQRQELNEVLRLSPSLLPARLDLARSLIRSNASKAALTMLDAAPPAQQKMVAFVETRNWALLDVGDYAGAQQGVAEGLRAAKTPELLSQLALLKLRARDYAGARASAEEALRIQPTDLRAMDLMVQSYVAQKSAPMAIQKVQEYAARSPKSAPVQFYLGRLFSQAGDLAAARKAFNAAVAADRNFIPAITALAQLDLDEGKTAEARKRLDGLLAIDQGNVAAHFMIGQIEFAARNFAAAAEQFRTVAEANPRDGIALNNFAYALAESGRIDEALKYAQRAKEVAPASADVNDTLGWVMYRKGVYASAIQYLEGAVSKNNTALPKYHLAMAYIKAGQDKRGQEVLDAALKMDSHLPEAKMAQQILAEQRAAPAKK